MVEATGAPIVEYFAALEDPRIDRTKRHKLLDIVTIAICGTICGADNWVDIELFGNCKEEWFKPFLELPNGIPFHDTFGDVFARLDPEQRVHCEPTLGEETGICRFEIWTGSRCGCCRPLLWEAEAKW